MDFNFDQLTTLILDDALILIPVLYLIGMFLRQTPVVQDWLIVWVKLLIGLLGTVLLLGVGFDALVQGVLVTGGSVLLRVMIENTQNAVKKNRNVNGNVNGDGDENNEQN